MEKRKRGKSEYGINYFDTEEMYQDSLNSQWSFLNEYRL